VRKCSSLLRLLETGTRLCRRYWPFLRYLLVGGWNTLFGMGVYALLYRCLGERIHYLVLLVPANILAITNAYLGYKFIVFRTSGNMVREYLRCYVVYGGMMMLSAGLLFVFVEYLKLNPVYANAVCVLVATVISYFSHKHFSFR